ADQTWDRPRRSPRLRVGGGGPEQGRRTQRPATVRLQTKTAAQALRAYRLIGQPASRAVAKQGARAAFCLPEGGMAHQTERRNPMVARTTALWIVLLVGCASANANRNTLTSELSDSARTPRL